MFAIWKYSSYIPTEKIVDYCYVLESLQKFTQFPKRTVKNLYSELFYTHRNGTKFVRTVCSSDHRY